MASNFTMRFQRNNGSLDIIIKGDFDGSSAHALLEALRRKSDDMQKITVNTDGLKNIYDFGLTVFQGHLPSLNRQIEEIVITGKNRVIFASREYL